MRRAEYPIPPTHDETVEEQRAGYCVEIVARSRQFFASDTDHQCGWVAQMYHGITYYCPPSGNVKVYPSEVMARHAAIRLGGRVTTVPRWNGHFREWSVLT